LLGSLKGEVCKTNPYVLDELSYNFNEISTVFGLELPRVNNMLHQYTKYI